MSLSVSYPLSAEYLALPSNKSVVDDLRAKYGKYIEQYSDSVLVEAFNRFCGSEDYYTDKDLILNWIEAA